MYGLEAERFGVKLIYYILETSFFGEPDRRGFLNHILTEKVGNI